MSVVILLTATKASRRMGGRDKLLEQVAGVPLISRQAQRACATGARVIVTLPDGGTERRAALDWLEVEVIALADAQEGMAASIRAGARAAEGAAGIMVLPADMPDIDTADMAGMIAAFLASDPPPPILRATTESGDWGHPVIIPARHFAALAGLAGDSGARDLLRDHSGEVRPHPLAGDRAMVDLDTPEAWQAWRARNPSHLP